MMPELGQVFLILALLLAAVQAVVPLIGAQLNDSALMRVARPAAYGQFVFVVSAYAVLTWGFITQDFSIAYVAQNSNLQLPEGYRISAVWGAHEGSLLLGARIEHLDRGAGGAQSQVARALHGTRAGHAGYCGSRLHQLHRVHQQSLRTPCAAAAGRQ